jgi:hypothetical protein
VAAPFAQQQSVSTPHAPQPWFHHGASDFGASAPKSPPQNTSWESSTTSRLISKTRQSTAYESSEDAGMDVDDDNHGCRRRAVVGAKWKNSQTSTATRTPEHTDPAEDVTATPSRKESKSVSTSMDSPQTSATTNNSVSSLAPSRRGSNVAPSPGRALACNSGSDQSSKYNFYTNDKIFRLIHSKWPRPNKPDGLSRVKFPITNGSAKNNQYYLELYDKDQKGGWRNPNEFPLLLTRECLDILGLDYSDFFPSLGGGCLVSLLYQADRKGKDHKDRKPVLPNSLDPSRDPDSDGTGINHAAQLALAEGIRPNNNAGRLTHFLSDSFVNRDLLSSVQHEMARLNPAPQPTPFVAAATPAQDLSTLLAQAVMDKVQTLQESAQKHSMDMLQSQQTANKQMLTELHQSYQTALTSQQNANQQTVNQLVGEVGAQLKSRDAAAALAYKEQMSL